MGMAMLFKALNTSEINEDQYVNIYDEFHTELQIHHIDWCKKRMYKSMW